MDPSLHCIIALQGTNCLAKKGLAKGLMVSLYKRGCFELLPAVLVCGTLRFVTKLKYCFIKDLEQVISRSYKLPTS